MEAVKRAIEAGLGVSVFSRNVIQRELSTGILYLLSLAARIGSQISNQRAARDQTGSSLPKRQKGRLEPFVVTGSNAAWLEREQGKAAERHFLSISSISGICACIQDTAAIAMGDCR
jgi:hypothetical protein